jgi:transaldolase/glucose-6-phosphate isomerase
VNGNHEFSGEDRHLGSPFFKEGLRGLPPRGLDPQAEGREITMAKSNPLLRVAELGQSIWLDFIQRGMIESGELQQLIEKDGLKGITSNPSIFEKVIDGSNDYDATILALSLKKMPVKKMVETIAVQDVQRAADLLRPLYKQTVGADGYVSLEVSPHLARDTEGTIHEARRLWHALNRPNVMIKIPATREGLPAIRTLIQEGLNINITLLFSLDRYEQVVDAYLEGLRARVRDGKSIEQIASVASFFLSRIDVLVDPILEREMEGGDERAALARRLHGNVAIASAKAAYQIYKRIFQSSRFTDLAREGASPQRLLWASTSTKNPDYSDVKYVEALIGPNTVNTLPMATLEAFRDHGQADARLEEGMDLATAQLSQLPDVGVDLDTVTDQLEAEGIEKFIQPYERLLRTMRARQSQTLSKPLDRQDFALNGSYEVIQDRIEWGQSQEILDRLWRKDTSIWSTDPETQVGIENALGWLNIPEKMEADIGRLQSFAQQMKRAGFRKVLHLGMGGSSLASIVFKEIFSNRANGISLDALDTTDPETILEAQAHLPLEQTLFIVASKSGTTAETLALEDYFSNLLAGVGTPRVKDHFAIITDPGSPLAEASRSNGYQEIFLNARDIGGRYSALSYFGLVPAALIGVDVRELLTRALRMRNASGPSVPMPINPGGTLGAVLGEAALQGRDKVTFVSAPVLAPLTAWLEQLLAESTGKDGSGLIPIVGEKLGPPEVYKDDRIFVAFHLHGDRILDQEELLALEKNGNPVVHITLNDLLDIGQEFFRWELATAVAGSILGVNPFDQPNVQESKDNTDRLLMHLMESGEFPEEMAPVESEGLFIYGAHEGNDLSQILKWFFQQAGEHGYFALMAFLQATPETEDLLQELRHFVRDRLHMATTLGFGPRFLHSTGQLFKGGPEDGLFLQLTADSHRDIVVPGTGYTFSLMKQAQALGDFESLQRHGRKVLRIHLGHEVQTGLETLLKNMKEIL